MVQCRLRPTFLIICLEITFILLENRYGKLQLAHVIGLHLIDFTSVVLQKLDLNRQKKSQFQSLANLSSSRFAGHWTHP